MATKVKPSRLQVSGTPQVGQVPVYVDEDTFQWGAGGGGGTGDVSGPASSTDGDIVLFDGATGKVIKDSGVGLSSKLDATALSNNAYGGGWNGDTTHTPTKDALYDKIHTMDVEIGNKAADTSVVKLTGNQTIAGTKTFSTSPVVPSKTTDATNTGTAIATEAQVYKVDSKVSDLFGLGKFLSLWNATTGQPISFPLATPYTYSTGDYFLVETVSSATPPVNYKPNGSSYTGAASSTTESDEVEVGDIYIYDGSTWLLQLNHGKTVSFSEIAGDPYDNTNLSNALVAKQDELVSGTNIRTINGTSILGSGDITTPVGPTYTAGNGISIGSVVINGRQGPSPEGFHVPSADEWAGLKDIMDSAGLSSGNNWRINLYMPFSGNRYYDDGSVDVQGTEGYYWSSTPLSGTGLVDESSYNLLIATAGNAKPREYNIRSFGCSIRCFKDTPVEIEDPTNPGGDWVLITNVGAGFYIYHSQSLGVITIMNDNSGWEYITIADKNLGATTVYNDGDALSEANCGKYYQWGNNYGFPWTGAITTSGTQVDASGYGPGNYYSSSTFIPRIGDWSSVRNPNLWGDITGTITQDAISNTGVLSVNGQTGNVTLDTFQLAPNSPLTPKYRRYGTQAQYEALAQYYTDEPGDTVYFTM